VTTNKSRVRKRPLRCRSVEDQLRVALSGHGGACDDRQQKGPIVPIEDSDLDPSEGFRRAAERLDPPPKGHLNAAAWRLRRRRRHQLAAWATACLFLISAGSIVLLTHPSMPPATDAAAGPGQRITPSTVSVTRSDPSLTAPPSIAPAANGKLSPSCPTGSTRAEWTGDLSAGMQGTVSYLALINVSSRACSVEGYPHPRIEGLSTQDIIYSSESAANPAPIRSSLIVLRPGEMALIQVLAGNPLPQSRCRQSHHWQVELPGSVQFELVAEPAGGSPTLCSNATVQVSPVYKR